MCFCSAFILHLKLNITYVSVLLFLFQFNPSVQFPTVFIDVLLTSQIFTLAMK